MKGSGLTRDVFRIALDVEGRSDRRRRVPSWGGAATTATTTYLRCRNRERSDAVTCCDILYWTYVKTSDLLTRFAGTVDFRLGASLSTGSVILCNKRTN